VDLSEREPVLIAVDDAKPSALDHALSAECIQRLPGRTLEHQVSAPQLGDHGSGICSARDD
jgi:hypothetical protein